MPDGEFDTEGLMNSLRVESRSLAVSAGTVMIEAIMDSEPEQMAGRRYSRKTDVDRWGTESGYVLLGSVFGFGTLPHHSTTAFIFIGVRICPTCTPDN